MIKKVVAGILCLSLLGGCSLRLARTSETSEIIGSAQQKTAAADTREDYELYIVESKKMYLRSTIKGRPEENVTTQEKSVEKSPVQSTDKKPANITPQQAIKTAQSKLPKDTKLYVSIYDMQTGESSEHNANIKVFPASTIKVLYAAVYYSCLEAGKFNLDTVHILKKEDKYTRGIRVGGTGVLQNQPNGTKYTYRELLSHMITDSDNVAANIITRTIGFNTIKKKTKEWGLSNTSCQREMYESNSPLPGNTTTMHDLTKLLKLIESGKIINAKNHNYLIEDMKDTKKDRLGKYAPDDVIIANKTGEVSYTRADIGIVYFKNRKPLIISALVKRDNRKAVSVSKAEEAIGTMTENLINYYKSKL